MKMDVIQLFEFLKLNYDIKNNTFDGDNLYIEFNDCNDFIHYFIVGKMGYYIEFLDGNTVLFKHKDILTKEELKRINQVINMCINIDDAEMENIIDEFLKKSKRNDIYSETAFLIKNILESFDKLVNIYYTEDEEE
jgi:hypothetical protein